MFNFNNNNQNGYLGQEQANKRIKIDTSDFNDCGENTRNFTAQASSFANNNSNNNMANIEENNRYTHRKGKIYEKMQQLSTLNSIHFDRNNGKFSANTNNTNSNRNNNNNTGDDIDI